MDVLVATVRVFDQKDKTNNITSQERKAQVRISLLAFNLSMSYIGVEIHTDVSYRSEVETTPNHLTSLHETQGQQCSRSGL